MHSGQESQESQGTRRGQTPDTSTETFEYRPYVVLHAGFNLAQLFRAPLTSDLTAPELEHLFGSPRPRVPEVEQEHGIIHWADVVRVPKYEPERQDDGNYHVRLDKGNALVELPGRQHEVVMTDVPRQLIDPYSYPSDVVSELSTVKSAMAQIKP